MKIFPQLQGQKRALVFFIVAIVFTLANGFFLYITRDPLTLILELVFIGSDLLFGYKAFVGE